MFGRRPEPSIDHDTREWLAQEVEVEVGWGEEPRTQPRFEALRCPWCQGVHFRACPRVESIEYHENGQVRRVKFWPEGAYHDDDVIWPEMVFATEDAGT